MRISRELTPRLRPAPFRLSLAALAAFGAVACFDEPTSLDRDAYAWAERHYDRRIELAQYPLELFGLPGY